MPVENPANNLGEHAGSDQTPGDCPGALAGLDGEARYGFDLTGVLHDVLSTTMRSVSAEGGFILILDEGGWPSHWFLLKDGQGKLLPPTRARVAVERGIVGWVIQHQRGELVDDLTKDTRWSQSPDITVSAGQRSALCLPLVVYSRVVGVLMLVHRKPGFFESRHQSLLQGSSERVALAVENARLYETQRCQAEESAALREVSLNISADQPLGRLLDTVVAQAMDLLRCQGAGLFMWQEGEAELELVAAYDPEIDLRGMRVAPGEGLVGRVFKTGVPLTLDENADWRTNACRTAARGISFGLPVTAAMAVPLVWQGLSLGVLVSTDRTPGRHFGHRDQRLLTALANHAAAVIASVQLHERTSRHLKELAFFNDTIQEITATLDLDEILAILTRQVKDMLGAGACSIALVHSETNEIDHKHVDFDIQSVLAAPMISRGQVVGVIEGLNKPGGFHAEDERLLRTLASLAAGVVENANLVSAQREAEQSHEKLMQIIVHDLRGPVGTISNSLQLLHRLLNDGASAQAVQLFGIASRATRRLLNLVETLHDLRRLEIGRELTNQRPISVRASIQSARSQMAQLAQRKRIRLNVELPDRLPLVMADGGMIERVLVNLMNNALKFTSSDGEVSVSVEEELDQLYVRVRDEGPGIPPENQRRIFEKFLRTPVHEGVGGAGLDLVYCRLVVEAHGGRIWVESSSRQGSTFVFTLPLGGVLDSSSDLTEP